MSAPSLTPDRPSREHASLTGGALLPGALPFGVRADGRMVHVSDVPSGLACGCTCPGCGGRLVARKGRQIVHHFAHASGEGCTGGAETALHRMGKQVLLDGRQLMLPPVPYSGKPGVMAGYDRVWDEIPLGHGAGSIKPDIIIAKGRALLMVEIAVTHRSTDEKKAWLVENARNAVEIDLSDLHGRLVPDMATIREAVTNSARRHWVYHTAIAEHEESENDARRARLYARHRQRLQQEEALREDGQAQWRVIPSHQDAESHPLMGAFRAVVNCLPRPRTGTSFTISRGRCALEILSRVLERPYESWSAGRILEVLAESGVVKECTSPQGTTSKELPDVREELSTILNHLVVHRLLVRGGPASGNATTPPTRRKQTQGGAWYQPGPVLLRRASKGIRT